MMRRGLMVLGLLLAHAAVLGAQTRVRVTVDYVTASSIYLSAGQQQGLFATDTVAFQRDTLRAPAGKLVIVSSTRSRAVAEPVDSSFKVARGEILFVTIGASAQQRVEAARAAAAEPQPDNTPARETAVPAPARPRRKAHTSGRLGLEFDALRTSARYGTGEDQTNEHTYTSPTVRLRLRTDNLPGGVRFSTNLRATRLAASAARPAEFRLQLYQASLEADIRPAGVHLQVGRFYSPYESHSGYWDGMLLRFGGTGMGGGVVLGYAPARANQDVSSLSPKFSAFVDAHARNGNWRYDVDISAHQQNNVFLAGEREFIGISQSIGYRRAYFTQRVQIGKTAGAMALWQAQFTGSAALAGPLSVNARYTTERNDVFFSGTDMLGRRTRWSAGAVLSGRAGFLNLEGGMIDSGLGTRSRMASANFFIPRALYFAGLGLSANTARDDRFSTTYLAPYIERYSGRVRARLGASYYRTDYGATVFEQKGGDFSLALPLGKRTELGWTASATTGSSMQSARTALSFWQSF